MMTQEEKNLLLTDLCGRLPYGVKLYANYVDGIDAKESKGRLALIDSDLVVAFIDEVEDANSFTYVALHEVKPYLFPLSSMTKEQKIEYSVLCYEEEREYYECGEWVTRVYLHNTIESIDWLNKNHFDYRGLIEKGLAKDTTELNIY